MNLRPTGRGVLGFFSSPSRFLPCSCPGAVGLGRPKCVGVAPRRPFHPLLSKRRARARKKSGVTRAPVADSTLAELEDEYRRRKESLAETRAALSTKKGGSKVQSLSFVRLVTWFQGPSFATPRRVQRRVVLGSILLFVFYGGRGGATRDATYRRYDGRGELGKRGEGNSRRRPCAGARSRTTSRCPSTWSSLARWCRRCCPPTTEHQDRRPAASTRGPRRRFP